MEVENVAQETLAVDYEHATIELTPEEEIAKLQAELAALKSTPVKLPKNKVPGKADANRNYVLLSKSLKSWGRVPAQQAAIADLLAKNFELNVPIPEPVLFAKIEEESANYPVLANSVQDPTYIFKYYRGLKNDGKHASFVAREFLRYA